MSGNAARLRLCSTVSPPLISDDHELIRGILRMAASRPAAEATPTGRGYYFRTCNSGERPSY